MQVVRNRSGILGSRSRLIRSAVIASAVVTGSTLVPSASAAVLYTFNTPLAVGGTANWSDGTNWTAPVGTANGNNYPGGDAGIPDDSALINPLVGGYGAYTVNYAGILAPSLSAITIKAPLTTASPAPVAGDVITLNVNAPLTVTGALTLTGSNATVGKTVVNVNSAAVSVGSLPNSGAVTLTIAGTSTLTSTGALTNTAGAISFSIANGSSATFGGMTAGSAGAISGTVNGNLTTTSYVTNGSTDSGNLTISASATTVSLGTVSIQRSTSSTSNTTTGIHVKGGAVAMGNVQIGVTNSGALMEIGGGAVTISGTFNAGQNGGNVSRPGQIYIDGGILTDTNAAGLLVGQGVSPTVGAGSGLCNISSGTATLEKITLGGVTPATTGTGTNTGTLTVGGGALYVGSGGISGTTAAAVAATSYGSAYTITLNGGVLGAKAPWSSAANMTLATTNGGITVQAADAGAASNDISLSGVLSGATGTLKKTGLGNLTLSGSDTFGGATTVSAGALLVNNAITASAITVATAGSLGGIGAITPAVVNNGTVNPGSAGAGSIGNLSMGGGVTFGDNSTYGVDLNATSSDKLLVTGSIALGNNDTLTLNILDGTTSGMYVIATYTGTETGTFANLPANVTVDYTTGNAITLTLSAPAPEPASLSVLTLGAAALVRRRRWTR